MAIAILMAVVWAMTTIFTQSDRVWEQGTSRVEVNTEGRAALQMLQHDIEYAIIGTTVTFRVQKDRKNIVSYGFTNDEICVVSLQHDSSDNPGTRTVREIHYYVRENTNALGRYQLVRGYWSGEISDDAKARYHCYHNPNWYKTGAPNPGRPTYNDVLADNVTGVAFFAPVKGFPGMAPNYRYGTYDFMSRDYDSVYYTNQLPHYLDIFIELLSERDAQILTKIPQGEQNRFIEKHARRYTTRAFFSNRNGYQNKKDRYYIAN